MSKWSINAIREIQDEEKVTHTASSTRIYSFLYQNQSYCFVKGAERLMYDSKSSQDRLDEAQSL